MLVYERSYEAIPLRILYPAKQQPRWQARYIIFFIIKLAISGVLFWLFARFAFGWPEWAATLFSIPCSYLGVVFYHIMRGPRSPREYDSMSQEID